MCRYLRDLASALYLEMLWEGQHFNNLQERMQGSTKQCYFRYPKANRWPRRKLLRI